MEKDEMVVEMEKVKRILLKIDGFENRSYDISIGSVGKRDGIKEIGILNGDAKILNILAMEGSVLSISIPDETLIRSLVCNGNFGVILQNGKILVEIIDEY
ncbi:MAG: hypothetical protein QXH07_05840 [Thermoplasmata archaeon]